MNTYHNKEIQPRVNILHIIGTLDPIFGGPIEWVRQFTLSLDPQIHCSEVLTFDAAASPWLTNFPAEVHAIGPSLGKYRLNSSMVPWLKKHAAKYDLILVHGIWQFVSLGTWLASRKNRFSYYVFPHGMLDPWFTEYFPMKQLKKWIYWHLAEYHAYRDAKAVLFTSQTEMERAAQVFSHYKCNGLVIHYGTSGPEGDPDQHRRAFLNAFPHLKGKRIILFLSRIHPKKGCDLLIDAFSEFGHASDDFHLVIAGPDNDQWIPQLQKRAHALGVDARITWTGMLTGDLKWGAYQSAEVFVLPSHSENFGIVVAEALACGLPVLITEKVNIWQEVEADRAGFVAADTKEGTLSLLRRWFSLGPSEQNQIRKNARDCFVKRYEIHNASKDFVEKIIRHTQGVNQ